MSGSEDPTSFDLVGRWRDHGPAGVAVRVGILPQGNPHLHLRHVVQTITPVVDPAPPGSPMQPPSKNLLDLPSSLDSITLVPRRAMCQYVAGAVHEHHVTESVSECRLDHEV